MQEVMYRQMNSLEVLGEIHKEMKVKQVKLSRIVQLMDCSPATAYRRLSHPEQLTLGDLERIGSYLNIKFHMGR